MGAWLKKCFRCFEASHDGCDRGSQWKAENDPDNRKKGLALMIAVIVVSLVMLFSASMIINNYVHVEYTLTQNDQVKAEYLAKSGINLGRFLIAVDLGVDLFQASQAMGQAAQPPTDTTGDIWSMLNGMPISGDLVTALANDEEGGLLSSLGLSDKTDGGVLSLLSEFEGQFAVEVMDEGGRINLSNCSILSTCGDPMEQMKLLFGCPAEKRFLEKKGEEPTELASRIRDWIDKNSSADGSGFSNENTPYEKYDPPYKAKNAPMDVLSELNLVEGWDRETHAVFSPYLTVYPVPQKTSDISKININTASAALLRCLFPESAQNCNQQMTMALQGVDSANENNEESEEESTSGIYASKETEIASLLQSKFCETDTEKAKWFTTRSDTFRIKAFGMVQNEEKWVETVVERRVPQSEEESLFQVWYLR